LRDSVFDYFINEDRYPDLDADGAVSRLAQAIRCVTVNNGAEKASDGEFLKLQEIIRTSFPNIMSMGSFELIGRSVLITIPGSDSSLLPSLYMSHQDVVPVVRGTENDWRYGAFSGAVEEGCIWGRGTLDIKNMVFGILEAAEYLLSKGETFRRTAYLAFGDDEETVNFGALGIAETLERRGVRLEFLLDEGGGVIRSGAPFGAPETSVSYVDLMEKGYADLELSVKSAGGHSSRPFGGTSLGKLSAAVADVAGSPFPYTLPDPVRASLRTLAPYMTEEPLRSLVSDIDANADEIAEFLAGQPETFPFVTTTIAPTMMEGGSAAANVMPQDMRAVINFRINQGTTKEEVMEHCRAAVTDPSVELRFLQANDPSMVSRSDGFGFSRLTETASGFFDGVVFIPCMTAGATDACRYENVCDTCLRFSPFMAETADVESGVHGTNERIPVRSYLQGIRFLIGMMENCNIR